MTDEVSLPIDDLEPSTSARNKRLASAPGDLPTGGLLEEFKKLQREQKEKRREEANDVHDKVNEVPDGGAASVLVNDDFITVNVECFENKYIGRASIECTQDDLISDMLKK